MPTVHTALCRTLHPTVHQLGQYHAQHDSNGTRDQLQRDVCEVEQVYGQQGAELKH